VDSALLVQVVAHLVEGGAHVSWRSLGQEPNFVLLDLSDSSGTACSDGTSARGALACHHQFGLLHHLIADILREKVVASCARWCRQACGSQ